MNFYSEEVSPLFIVMWDLLCWFFSVGFVVLPFIFPSYIFPLKTTSPVFHLFLLTFDLCESLVVPLFGPLTCLDAIFKTLLI